MSGPLHESRDTPISSSRGGMFTRRRDAVLKTLLGWVGTEPNSFRQRENSQFDSIAGTGDRIRLQRIDEARFISSAAASELTISSFRK